MNIKTENKLCQNCKKDFTIEPDDFSFYEKIKVPPPTFCPECRMVRKFLFRNDRALSKVKCQAPGHKEEVISIFDSSLLFPIYDHKYWWSDDWDPTLYGREYDFSRPFFEQYKDLSLLVPLPNIWSYNTVDSEYANYTLNSKNIYMSTSVAASEDVSFSMMTEKVRDVIDCLKIEESEHVYETINSYRLNNCIFLINSHDCIDSKFLFDCVNCSNCFMSTNLRNKSFYIYNRQYSKEAYQEKIRELNTSSFANLTNLRKDFEEFIANAVHRYANFNKVINSTGDNLTEGENAKTAFASYSFQNIKYVWRTGRIKDSYDVAGCLDSELIYEATVAGVKNYNSNFYHHSTATNNIKYSSFSPSGSNLFGCIACIGKSYCILNKQYTKEEYETLIPKVIQHMNDMPYIDINSRVYKYGEFFPAELSLFAYNETIAQEFFPITKEKATKMGYKWKDKKLRNYKPDISTEEIPDDISSVDESMLNKVIGCSHVGACEEQCTEAFKITTNELQFYKKMKLPLPRLCPNCRHFDRLKRGNPLKLWPKKCMCEKQGHSNHKGKCEVEFETSYAPERSEIVYCEKCYQQEVY